MAKYIRKNSEVEAWKFDGTYESVAEIIARSSKVTFHRNNAGAYLTVKPSAAGIGAGHWLVLHGNGDVDHFIEESFQSLFCPAPPEPTAELGPLELLPPDWRLPAGAEGTGDYIMQRVGQLSPFVARLSWSASIGKHYVYSNTPYSGHPLDREDRLLARLHLDRL